MKLYPLTVIEFQDMFPTDEACHEYLRLVRWPNGFVCPSCGATEYWKMQQNILRCKHCKKKISVTAGTIFQDLRKPLRLQFQAIWYIVCQKQGVSALGLKSILGLGSYQTAWVWLHKLRTAMVRPGRERLSGTVEVDEIFVGGAHSGKRGRGTEGKELVLVAVEQKDKKIGRVRLKHIPDASSATLEKAIAELIEAGSTIRTDGWKGYSKLVEKGYTHKVLIHPTQKPGEDPTPLVDKIASLLKRWLLGTHQGGQQFSHLHYYLDEFTFRFNRRTAKSRGQLFYRLVQQALEVSPAPLATLKAVYT
ncbi:MAG TPA: IS1595 family transposase [Methylomirabilota bacterium]|nr:IS1595 family transposase [Methylomirabilota bacterium]